MAVIIADGLHHEIGTCIHFLFNRLCSRLLHYEFSMWATTEFNYHRHATI